MFPEPSEILRHPSQSCRPPAEEKISLLLRAARVIASGRQYTVCIGHWSIESKRASLLSGYSMDEQVLGRLTNAADAMAEGTMGDNKPGQDDNLEIEVGPLHPLSTVGPDGKATVGRSPFASGRPMRVQRRRGIIVTMRCW